MKKRAKKMANRLADDCDKILLFFDEDCVVMNAMAEVTQKETNLFYEALHKGGLIDPDDLTTHENDIRNVAFATGFLFGSGQIVTGGNKAALRATKGLASLIESMRKGG